MSSTKHPAAQLERCEMLAQKGIKRQGAPTGQQPHVCFGSAALMKCDVNSQDHTVASDPQTNRNLKYVHLC